MDRNKGYMLSPIQKRISLLGEDIFDTFQKCIIDIKGPLNLEKLTRSITLLVEKHEILRTVYVKKAELSVPLQIISDTPDYNLIQIDRSRRENNEERALSGYSSDEKTLLNLNYTPPKPLFIKFLKLGENRCQLVLILPSISCDSYSLQLLVRELFELYDGAPDQLVKDELSIQYLHYSEWQNSLLEDPQQEALDFWDQYEYWNCEEVKLSFELKEQKNKPEYKLESLSLNSSVTKQLKTLAYEQNTSIGEIVLACFAALVHVHSGSEEFLIGYVNSDRAYEELKGVIGSFSKTLPLKVKSHKSQQFIDLVKAINTEKEKVLNWEEYFDWKKDWISNAESVPYFPLSYEYIDITKKIPSNKDLEIYIKHHLSITDKYDLKVTCLDFGDTVQIDINYLTKFVDDAISTFKGHFDNLLNSIKSDPFELVDRIMKVSEDEKKTITNTFNKKKNFSNDSSSIIDLFEEQVRKKPNSTAIEFNGKKCSYKELNKKANQLANYLIGEVSIKPQDFILVQVPRSEKLIISLLAVLKTGATYIPIDATFPEDRIKFIAEDSKAKAIIISGKEIQNLNLKSISPEDPILAKKTGTNLKRSVGLESAAYTIYTSGSTGAPKGVIVSHSSLVNYVNWFGHQYNINKEVRSLLLSSAAFDLSYTVLWPTILLGGTLCIMEEKEYLEQDDLISALITNKINFIKLTPSHFNIITTDLDFDKNVKKYSLKLIVLGGEEILVNDVEKFFKYNKEVVFVNHYGPTEATIGTVAETITYSRFKKFKRKPVIGSPILNNTVYILDAQNQICPIGIVGEISVAGKGVAKGYLNRADLNKLKFIENPFEKGSILYRTGDLGRWMPNGKIEFLGRSDFQIKIRGYRVEAGEIEKALLKDTRISNAVVLLSKDASEDSKLIAFIEVKERIKEQKLREQLLKFLPSYMVPADIFQIDSFPLTPNGKVNRKELLNLNLKEKQSSSYIAPRTSMEKKMCQIWKEVLSKEKVGIRDDFFSLGGHSLKATQIVSRIYKNLGIKIKLADIFANPTIEGLLNVIKRTNKLKYEQIQKVPSQITYNASHAQKRLWLLDQFEENQSAYNMLNAYLIEGELNIPSLEKAYEATIRRHESLRTTFVGEDGQPKQKINEYEKEAYQLEIIDISDRENAFEIACDISKEELSNVFSLEQGPLIKTKLIRLSDSRYALIMTLHHIISDGWSLRLLMNELLVFYETHMNGEEVPFQELRIQYKDYSEWHTNIISQKEQDYWYNKLESCPPLVDLPFDTNQVFNETANNPYVNFELDKEKVEGLRQIAQKHNTSLSNLILSAYALFINHISGQDEILIGVGHANRNHPDLENLIGFFVNLLIVRVDFCKDPTLISIIQQISKNSLEAYEHSNYPFDLLVEKFGGDRYSSSQPLVNVMYDFKNYNDVLIENENYGDETDLNISQLSKFRNLSKFDLTLFVKEQEDILSFCFEYPGRLFLEQTIRKFMNMLLELIDLMLRELIEKEEPVKY